MNHEQAKAQTEMLNSEGFQKRIVEIVIADIKKNGPIRMALLGLYPETKDKQKPDA